MTITGHPLHGSGRAQLTHPALALGDDAKATQRIRGKSCGQAEAVEQRNMRYECTDASSGYAAAACDTSIAHVVTKRTQRGRFVGTRNTIVFPPLPT